MAHTARRIISKHILLGEVLGKAPPLGFVPPDNAEAFAKNVEALHDTVKSIGQVFALRGLGFVGGKARFDGALSRIPNIVQGLNDIEKAMKVLTGSS